MPHNWASAECVRYLRHMLVLEDGQRLRLLQGVVPGRALEGNHYSLENTPTRFGRVTLQLMSDGSGKKADLSLDLSNPPAAIEIPASLGGRSLHGVAGAHFQRKGSVVLMDPEARQFSAYWR